MENTNEQFRQHLISLYNEANEQIKEIGEQNNLQFLPWEWNYFINSFENLDPDFYENIKQFKE